MFLDSSINLEEIILTHNKEINDYTPIIKCQKLKRIEIADILEINWYKSFFDLKDNIYMCLFELPILKKIKNFRISINENIEDIPWNDFESLESLDLNCKFNDFVEKINLNKIKKLIIQFPDEEGVLNLL